jgi:hypothetical protein
MTQVEVHNVLAPRRHSFPRPCTVVTIASHDPIDFTGIGRDNTRRRYVHVLEALLPDYVDGTYVFWGNRFVPECHDSTSDLKRFIEGPNVVINLETTLFTATLEGPPFDGDRLENHNGVLDWPDIRKKVIPADTIKAVVVETELHTFTRVEKDKRGDVVRYHHSGIPFPAFENKAYPLIIQYLLQRDPQLFHPNSKAYNPCLISQTSPILQVRALSLAEVAEAAVQYRAFLDYAEAHKDEIAYISFELSLARSAYCTAHAYAERLKGTPQAERLKREAKERIDAFFSERVPKLVEALPALDCRLMEYVHKQ